MGSFEAEVVRLVGLMLDGLGRDLPVRPFEYMERNLDAVLVEGVVGLEGRVVVDSGCRWAVEVGVQTTKTTHWCSLGAGHDGENDLANLVAQDGSDLDKARAILAEEIPAFSQHMQGTPLAKFDDVLSAVLGTDSRLGVYLGTSGCFALSAAAWLGLPRTTPHHPLPTPIVTLYEGMPVANAEGTSIEEVALIPYSTSIMSALSLVRSVAGVLREKNQRYGPRGGLALPPEVNVTKLLLNISKAVEQCAAYHERVKVVVHFGRGIEGVAGSPFEVIEECKKVAKLGMLDVVVDPFNMKEVDGWGVVKLLNFMLVGDEVLENKHEARDEVLLDAHVIHLTRHQTVSSLHHRISHLHAQGTLSILRTEASIAADPLPALLALHLPTTMVMFGGLFSGERTMLWNELLRAEEQLEEEGHATHQLIPPMWL